MARASTVRLVAGASAVLALCTGGASSATLTVHTTTPKANVKVATPKAGINPAATGPASNATTFQLNGAAGSVQFGNGQQGGTPPAGHIVNHRSRKN